MQEATVYSERLGAISDEQFHAVAERLRIGRFVLAAPTTSGLFGQNVFVTTTEGEFVLRGAPHWVRALHETQWRQEDRWQFSKEKYFAEQLHAHTNAPVPWPMLHDETSDILGWPYLVMPRMPGVCFDERSIRKALRAGRPTRGCDCACGRRWPTRNDSPRRSPAISGSTSIALEPYPVGATQHVVDETRRIRRPCRAERHHDGRRPRVARRGSDARALGSRAPEHVRALRLQAEQPDDLAKRRRLARERPVRPARSAVRRRCTRHRAAEPAAIWTPIPNSQRYSSTPICRALRPIRASWRCCRST